MFYLSLLGSFFLSVLATSEYSDWQSLNASYNGRLQRAVPFSRPCFSLFNGQNVSVEPDTCTAVQEHYLDIQFRVKEFGAYMNTQWEMCQKTAEGCLLDGNNPSDANATSGGRECSQGSVPPYYISIQDVSDIQIAFSFSKKTGIPLAIKNSGHDYLGRSSQKGGLGLWMQSLKKLQHIPNFVPEGCPSSTQPLNAVTMDAGVLWEDAYQFAEDNNVTLVGGYAGTIGASGGWVMGGGHSVLSPAFGLGVDRVLQFKLVTPDGHYRTANKCHNPDLFWALRGGGGGTFGVVMESTHLAEPAMTLQVANFTFSLASGANVSEFYEIVIEHSVRWSEEGWGGHVRNQNFIYVNPFLSPSAASASLAPLAQWIETHNGTAFLETVPSWNVFYKNYVVPNTATAGKPTLLGVHLIPSSVFSTPDNRQSLRDIMLYSVSLGTFPYIVATPPFGYKNYTRGATSVTPVWRDAIWEVGFGGSWNYDATAEDIENVYNRVDEVNAMYRDLAPNEVGVYFNEGNPRERNHEHVYWGDNYPRLLEVKEKYDPEGLLQCWKCVGWKGPSEPRFSCYV